MKTTPAVLLLACILGGCTAAPKPTSAPAPTSNPTPAATNDRAARAESCRKLRLGYARSAEYDPYNTKVREIRTRSVELLDKDDFKEAIAETARGLAIDKYNIDLLMTRAAAFRASGDIKNADDTRQRWMSLMDSIVTSGDGRSFKTAFQVISVDEEYALLAVMGLRMENQMLVENDGSEFDVLSVKAENSDQVFDLYFNVDIPLKWLNKHLSGG